MTAQLFKMADAVGWLGLLGLVCWAAWGRERLRGQGVLLLAAGLCYGFFVAAFVFFGRAEGRYYQSLTPMVFVLAGGGYYALADRLGSRRMLRAGLVGLAVVACVFFSIRAPILPGRKAQTEAGLWLRRHDPGYHRFVLSRYSQPVYYAGMSYLPAYLARSREDYEALARAGCAPRYAILDGSDDPTCAWVGEMVKGAQWELVFSEEQRHIRIYETVAPRAGGPTE